MADAIINSMVKDLVSSTNSTMENGMKLSPYDRTYTAKVSGGNLQGGYDVSFNGVTYTGIKTLGGSCVANEIVKLIVPQNNYSQMFILKFAEADNTDGTSGSDSGYYLSVIAFNTAGFAVTYTDGADSTTNQMNVTEDSSGNITKITNTSTGTSITVTY